MEFERHVNIFKKKLENPMCAELEDDEIELPELLRGSNADFNAASSGIELRYIIQIIVHTLQLLECQNIIF